MIEGELASGVSERIVGDDVGKNGEARSTHVGRPVQVIRGPLQGIQGTVFAVEANGSYLLALTEIGAGVFARIPTEQLLGTDGFPGALKVD